jgi:scyllo-inositol 2-dehydrogenase (NADP+)
LKVIVIGQGVQGRKRAAAAASDVVATVDPLSDQSQYGDVEEVPLEEYGAALVCTPDTAKLPILRYLLSHGKHVLVEKPLIADRIEDLHDLAAVAQLNQVACYTAYNHRFEPHILKLKEVIDCERLGKIYSARFYYGNGTARDVRNSSWRDQGLGVLPDLGSHLLDIILLLFGQVAGTCRVWRADSFENRAFDRVIFGFHDEVAIDCEVTLLSWRNTFQADVHAEQGSAHISGLCKWGSSVLTVRKRQLPSGVPSEESVTLISKDPTWDLEYSYFKSLCASAKNNIANDIWIQLRLKELEATL